MEPIDKSHIFTEKICAGFLYPGSEDPEISRNLGEIAFSAIDICEIFPSWNGAHINERRGAAQMLLDIVQVAEYLTDIAIKAFPNRSELLRSIFSSERNSAFGKFANFAASLLFVRRGSSIPGLIIPNPSFFEIPEIIGRANFQLRRAAPEMLGSGESRDNRSLLRGYDSRLRPL